MQNIPLPTLITFLACVIFTIFIYYRASRQHQLSLYIILSWVGLQSFIGLSGFYQVTDTLPPRFMALLLPTLLLIVFLFSTKGGRNYINALDIKYLTLLHVVRIPVEMVLLQLYIHHVVPKIMTFEGINYDIISGLTAPIIYYFGYVKNKLPNTLLLVWNFLCLGLLINVVYHGLFSAPTLFQKYAFDQPNIALFYFPYIFLPGLIVPMVLFSHLVSIRSLLRAR